MFHVARSRTIYTGVIGTLGCLTMGVAAILAIDDATISNVQSTERVLMLFCGGAALGMLHAYRAIRRAGGGPVAGHPRRRRTDFGGLDQGERGA
jgi:hypothetical protein